MEKEFFLYQGHYQWKRILFSLPGSLCEWGTTKTFSLLLAPHLAGWYVTFQPCFQAPPSGLSNGRSFITCSIYRWNIKLYISQVWIKMLHLLVKNKNIYFIDVNLQVWKKMIHLPGKYKNKYFIDVNLQVWKKKMLHLLVKYKNIYFIDVNLQVWKIKNCSFCHWNIKIYYID